MKPRINQQQNLTMMLSILVYLVYITIILIHI